MAVICSILIAHPFKPCRFIPTKVVYSGRVPPVPWVRGFRPPDTAFLMGTGYPAAEGLYAQSWPPISPTSSHRLNADTFSSVRMTPNRTYPSAMVYGSCCGIFRGFRISGGAVPVRKRILSGGRQDLLLQLHEFFLLLLQLFLPALPRQPLTYPFSSVSLSATAFSDQFLSAPPRHPFAG